MGDGTLQEGHQKLGAEFCAAYYDNEGSWHPGFYCRNVQGQAFFCCGDAHYKYCCRKHDQVPQQTSSFTLILGVIFGALAAIVIVIIVSCFYCSCCILYKKRQPATNAGRLYQLHCSSTTSGVANMYSLSNQHSLVNVPMDTAVLVDLEARAMTDGRPQVTMAHGHTFSFPSPKNATNHGIKKADGEPNTEEATMIRPAAAPPPYDANQQCLLSVQPIMRSTFSPCCTSTLTRNTGQPPSILEEVNSVLSSSATSEETGGGSSSLSGLSPYSMPVPINKTTKDEILYHSTKF
ncbi:uncharacterized protein LOC126248688 [Schistocerca nitens]|uniref:uncharacterized protein LOC126248688 n=1 Tax=Schistocerca nitens TaxID=7011 RepID=UPI002118369A|nr:uncharacterized protein LOC126248688 [Schistocerca nitens]XP_049805922.1 uncharacterized protein LOC126248688 [Schistocerca nitens]